MAPPSHDRRLAPALVALVALVAPPRAGAAPLSKDECVDAHSRGQDARDRGQLTQARQLFLSCAQAACPALVQADCAHLGDEAGRLVPSLSFAARDARQNDLPDAAVYVDGTLVATRLDDGRAHELDPGKHTVRFAHEGREVSLGVVVAQGEKGRTIIGTFPDRPSPPSAPAPVSAAGPPPPGSRPLFPLALAGAGGAALVTGAALVAVGFGRVPASCELDARECAAPPGDPAFDDAKDGVALANVGFVVGGVGAAALVGGLLWYLASPRGARPGHAVAPYATRAGVGLALGGSF